MSEPEHEQGEAQALDTRRSTDESLPSGWVAATRVQGMPQPQETSPRADDLTHREFLDGEPVAEATEAQFDAIREEGGANERLDKKIATFYKEGGNSEVEVAGIGRVNLDLRAVRNSRGHGSKPERLTAFVLVPDILKKGRLVDTRPMSNDARGRFHHVAAPVRIDGRDFIAVVQVRSPHGGITRMYVHQVVSKEKLQLSQYYRADTGKAVVQTSGQREAGVAEQVLHRIYSVKSDPTVGTGAPA